MALPSSLARKLISIMSSAAEEGFLKLVYPKRRIELLRHPITAAQVLEKNPRCCVARPDVFKNPWFVVRPESVLSLGRVFYVVPRHTIQRLLQQHGISPHVQAQKALLEQESPQQQALPWNVEIRPRRKTYRGEESIDVNDSVDEDRKFIELRLCKVVNDRELAEFHSGMKQDQHQSQIKTLCREVKEDSDDSIRRQRVRRSSNSNRVFNHIDKPPVTEKQNHRLGAIEPQKKQYPVEHWPINPDTKKHHYQQLKPFDSCGSFRPNIGGVEASSSTTEKPSNLKSCLKKQTINGTRSHRLRVSFNEEVEVCDLNERICTS